MADSIFPLASTTNVTRSFIITTILYYSLQFVQVGRTRLSSLGAEAPERQSASRLTVSSWPCCSRSIPSSQDDTTMKTCRRLLFLGLLVVSAGRLRTNAQTPSSSSSFQCQSNADCLNGGNCLAAGNGDDAVVCQCPPGTGGDDCSADCPRACKNRGSCRFYNDISHGSDQDGSTFCDCRGTEHIGVDCEIPFVACPNDVKCLHGGTCTATSESQTGPCQCPSDRTGDVCQFDINHEEDEEVAGMCPVQENANLCTPQLIDSAPSDCDCYAFCDDRFVKCQSQIGGVLRADECPNGTPISGCHSGIAASNIFNTSSGSASGSAPSFSTGATVGIALGAVAAIGLVVSVAVTTFRKKRTSQQQRAKVAKVQAATADLELTEGDLDVEGSAQNENDAVETLPQLT